MDNGTVELNLGSMLQLPGESPVCFKTSELSNHQEVGFTHKNIHCGFLGFPFCNKKSTPERHVSLGSYKLYVNNVAH